LDVADVNVYIRAIRRTDTEPTELDKAMTAAGISARWLGGAAGGINHQHIRNVAAGRGGIERRKADAIAKVLGVPVSKLFSADGTAA
jgi:hypothetical protein